MWLGGVCGLEIIEDVLEQLVGKIDDEHDDDEKVDIQQHGSGRYSVRALTTRNDFNDYFNTEYDSQNVETIGGYLLGNIGHLPERGETLALDNLTFKVVNADSRQVHLFQVVDESE